MFYLSSFFIITIAFIFGICFLLPGNISEKVIFTLWYAFIISLAVFSFFAEPSVYDDLYSHYYDIDQIRNGYGFRIGTLKGIGIVFWLVSKLPSNGFLPFASVIIFGICIAEIAKEYYNKESYNTKNLIMYFVLATGSCNVFYIISGIRCSLVAVLWGLAYFKLYNHKKIKEFIIVELLLSLLHYIAILFFIIHISYLILMKINKKRAWISSLFVFVVFIIITKNSQAIGKLLLLFGSNSTGSLGDKWVLYTTDYTGGMEIENTLRFITIIILVVCYFYPQRKKKEDEKFILYLAAVYLSTNIGFTIIAERLPYLIGVVSLPLIDSSMKKYGKGRFFIQLLLFVFFIVQLLYGFHSMFSHMKFYGYDIKNILNSLIRLW